MDTGPETGVGRAYRLGCQAAVSLPEAQRTAETNRLWKQYLIDARKAGETPGLAVYDHLSSQPRYVALMLARNYVMGKIPAKAFIAQTKLRLGDAYVRELQLAGLIEGNPLLDPAYTVFELEIHLETVKAYTPLIEPIPVGEDDCGRLAYPVSVMWFRFLDLSHTLLGLPDVTTLKPHLTTWSETERDVLEAGVFDEYAIVDEEERAEYEALLGRA